MALLVATNVLGGCAPKQDAQQEQSSPETYDRLVDYTDPLLPIHLADGYRMGVDEFMEVRPDLSDMYFGVGTLGNLCLVTFVKNPVLNLMSATVLKRYEDAPPIDEIGLVPMKKISQYVVHSRQFCTTQRA